MTLLDILITYRWHLLAGIATLYVVRKFVRYRRLRQFGGPWVAGFSYIPHDIKTFTGEAHSWYCDISEKYGRFIFGPV